MPELKTSLLDVPWRDVIFINILPYLSLRDIYALRGVSQKFKFLVSEYMRVCYSLDVSCTCITEYSFQALTSSCKNLRSVSTIGCRKLYGEGLIELFKQNSKNLLSLNISHCPNLSSAVLQAFAVHCSNLRRLHLGHSPWLNSEGLQMIMLHLDHVEYLDISKCWDADSETLCHLLSRYPKLKEVNFSYVEVVDENVLEVLATNCRQIRKLNLNNCWKITEKGLKSVLEWCPLLRSLEVKFCPKVSEQFLISVTKKGVNVHTKLIRRGFHFGLNLQI